MNKRFLKMFEPRIRMCYVMLFIFTAVSFYFGDVRIAIAEAVACAVLLVLFIILSRKRKSGIQRYVEELMTDINRASKDSTLNFPMAAAVLKLSSKEVIWGNTAFEEMIGSNEKTFEESIFNIIPDFELGWVLEGKTECPFEMKIRDKRYRVYGSLFRNDESDANEALVTLYWLDVTEYSESVEEFENSRQIVSVIMFDNYAEIMDGIDDAERSSIVASVDKCISEWVAPTNGILIKHERDKYLYLFEERYLAAYTDSKFAILDEVRKIESKSGIRATLSIGIGKDGTDFKENYRYAKLAIDMALSRGGDQTVIRNKFNFDFFGGRSQEFEKRTKVKSRVMANALAGLIKDSSDVIIMGHKNADNDSIGAAVGIACIARKIGKNASIVVEKKTTADVLVKRVRAEHEYDGVFISAEDAILDAGSNTLVVVVDTNRKSVVESEALLESANKIAVIDHHRRGTDYIEGAVLNFHEPYASSTCELVSELMQYIVETRDVLNVEAEAILSGIVIDTKKFTMKTGVRTFEAAAYLRRAGADTTELKRILQDDIETYVKRAEIVKLAHMYHDNVAIVEYNALSTRKIAAQAADELLSISGVKASFVLCRDGDSIIVSARSLGQINVQVILEKLGGGGHFDTAGAQVINKKIDEVSEMLKQAIDDVLD